MMTIRIIKNVNRFVIKNKNLFIKLNNNIIIENDFIFIEQDYDLLETKNQVFRIKNSVLEVFNFQQKQFQFLSDRCSDILFSSTNESELLLFHDDSNQIDVLSNLSVVKRIKSDLNISLFINDKLLVTEGVSYSKLNTLKSFPLNSDLKSSLWSYILPLNQSIANNLDIVNNVIIISSQIGDILDSNYLLYGIDINTGKKLWVIENTLPDYTLNEDNGLLYSFVANSSFNSFEIIDPILGKKILEKTIEIEKPKIISSHLHCIADNKLFFVDNDMSPDKDTRSRIGAIDLSTNTLDFIYQLDVDKGILLNKPKYADGKLYVLDSANTLHVFEKEDESI
ncbi:hypothetical protein ACSTS3_21125 [Aquimarina muelleri]|uniref:hypothetical protein n=1 Tax=Aquimarina muelleri TaxID=279356 RepID=UPI003F6868D1